MTTTATMMTIAREFTFEAAHHLPKTPVGHKCHTMHGHSYTLVVEVTGLVRDDGMIVDFNDIDYWTRQEIVHVCDHQTLNTIPGLENATLEVFGPWVFERLAARIDGLESITIFEGPHSRVTVKRI